MVEEVVAILIVEVVAILIDEVVAILIDEAEDPPDKRSRRSFVSSPLSCEN